MGTIVDGPKALQLLAECVEERGERYIYCRPGGVPGDPDGACLNWHHDTNEPGCIVGMALHKLGFTAEDLGAELKHTSVHFTISGLRDLGRIGPNGVVDDVTPAAVTVFAAAQQYQDTGSTWGEAWHQASDKLADLLND